VVIVQHFPGSAKQYVEANPFPGRSFTILDSCPHPDCQATSSLILWGTYARSARTGNIDYRILIQRIRCKVCGRTHSLLPDFLHPHRHYVIRLLQHAVSLYLIVGLGWGRLMNRLPPPGPARSTVREWIASFAYGAGHLLPDLLIRQLLALNPLTELPDTGAPSHLDRVSDPLRHLRLGRARHFWLLAERLYAQLKLRAPCLHFAAGQLLPFLLHWLQSQALPPRLFWNPTLFTTPTTPFGGRRASAF
jgi:hypothetical protein